MTTLSPQQSAVVDWVRDGHGSAFVEAVAGAGKTTTLVRALAETKGFVDFAAYNTKIAQEIKAKVAGLNLGNRVHVGTFHSFGFGAWRKAYPQVKAGPEAAKDKSDMTVKKFRSVDAPEALDGFVLKLVSLAKQRAIGLFGQIDDRKLWWDIIEHFDLAYEIDDEAMAKGETSLIEKGVDLAIRTLRWHREIAPKIIDFDDMVYMPVVSGVRMFPADWIFVDEAQDTNPCRRALARKMLKPTGRACFVGDRHQAIYGFTGADSDAIDQIVNGFNCEIMPLTVTFRCPKKVVEMAHEVVSHIQAADTAPEGNVGQLEYEDLMNLCKTGATDNRGPTWAQHPLNPLDAILCRNTKPLVKTAFMLIRAGVACHVEGKDIGMGLLKLIDRFKAKTITVLRDKLTAWSDKQVAKLIAKGKETQAEALRDRVDTVLVIMDSHPPAGSVAELRSRVQGMFMDAEHEAKPTLTLATVHKSKGREWGRVFVLGRNAYMPSRFARQEWQLQQERNLIYVCYTRAQRELILVNVPADF